MLGRLYSDRGNASLAGQPFEGLTGAKSTRTDDPLAGVTVPTSTGTNPARHETSHLEQVHADLVARNLIPQA